MEIKFKLRERIIIRKERVLTTNVYVEIWRKNSRRKTVWIVPRKRKTKSQTLRCIRPSGYRTEYCRNYYCKLVHTFREPIGFNIITAQCILYGVKTVTGGYCFSMFFFFLLRLKVAHRYKNPRVGRAARFYGFYDFRPCRQHFRCEGDTPVFYSKHRSLSWG